MSADPPYLGVESSVTGRRWIGPTAEAERMGARIAQINALPEVVGRILAARGVSPEEAPGFLDPKLRDLTPDPSTLRDMDKAAERLLAAVDGGQRIAIFGDYDVDGAASSAMLAVWLREMGARATLYAPDRLEEGYGPNVPAMEALAKAHDLIICVDCGAVSFEPVAAATALGADVVIADHHLGAETLPDAHAVVNPNRQDEDGALSHLCAAGVVFLLLVATNRVLRERGARAPDLMGLLDLAALATVADVAPLIGWNRALVRQGLRVMMARARPGLVALADAAKLTAPPTAHTLGYVLGPRINAGGRVGAADLGARLLSTADPHEAAALAERLDGLNTERRRIEADVLAAAMAQAETRDADAPLVWAAGQGWHPGVVGIVASRLKEAFNRPAVVIGLDGGTGAGSARSVPGVDMGASVARLVREGLALKGGGHRMAAGLTVPADGLNDVMTRLGELLAKQGAGAGGPGGLRIDGALAPSGVTIDLIETLERAGPFGQAAPAPRFAIAFAKVAYAKRVGENHLRLSLTGEGPGRLDAIAFRAFDGPLGEFLSSTGGKLAHVAGRVEIDDWGGRRVAKLRVEDAAEA